MTEALCRAGLEYDIVPARNVDMSPCTGCFGCWIRKPGECVHGGPAADIARAIVASDIVAIVTPVKFGSYSYEIKKILDRVVCSMLLPFFERVEGECHHPARYPSPPTLVALGTLPIPDSDAASVFETLVGRNALNLRCMYSVTVAAGGIRPGELALAADALLARAKQTR